MGACKLWKQGALVFWAAAAVVCFAGVSQGQIRTDLQSRQERGIEFDQQINRRSTGPRNQGRDPFNDGEVDLGSALGDLFRGVDQAIRNQQQMRPDPYPRYPQQGYREYEQPFRPAERPVAPRSNVRPPEPIKKVAPNTKPETGFTLASQAEMSLLEKVVEQAATEKLDEVATGLGDAAKDPEVKKILEEGKAKIKNGETPDAEWEKRLVDAIKTANGNAGTKLPQDFDNQKFNGVLDQFLDAAESNAALKKPANPTGVTGLGPGGMSNVVLVPALPADDLLVSPGGTLMVGSGGEGAITTTTVATSELLGMAVGVGDPAPDSTADFSKRVKSGVLLLNPSESGAEINYVIANNNYAMKPGYSQHLAEGQSWVIQFNRGGDFGEAKYTLSEGTYAFGASSKGWELYRQSISVTIDNTENDAVFFYNADNAQTEVAAGETQSHTSNYPIFIRFDRGDGGKETQKKVGKKDQLLKVAANPADGFWDLYPETSGGAAHPQIRHAANSSSENSSSRVARLRALLKAANE